jgi:hypothetical protein
MEYIVLCILAGFPLSLKSCTKWVQIAQAIYGDLTTLVVSIDEPEFQEVYQYLSILVMRRLDKNIISRIAICE